MKKTHCDICGQEATLTVEIYRHPPGFRSLFGLHMQVPRMAGKYVDLCAEHANTIDDLFREALAEEASI